MGRANATGRTKHEPFVLLHRGVTNSDAWRSLSCEAKALLIDIWARHNGRNNGQLGYGHREAKHNLRIGSKKAAEAFGQLEDRGFIVARTKSSFNWKTGAGAGLATQWELTAERCDGRPPSRRYRDWKKESTAPEASSTGTRAGSRSNPKAPNPASSGTRPESRIAASPPDSGTHGEHIFNLPGRDGGRRASPG